MVDAVPLVDAVTARCSRGGARDKEAPSRLIQGTQMLCCCYGEDNGAHVGQIAHPGGLTMREIARALTVWGSLGKPGACELA
jgi:hypothetical protein